MTPAEFVKKWPDADDRIRAHADVLMTTRVVAICANPSRPRVVGSGFFVSQGSSLYLISAAHVFAEQSLGGIENVLFFYTSASTAIQVAGQVRWARADHIDIGVIRLAEASPEWSGANTRQPIRLSDFGDLSTAGGADWFLLGGFPESKSRVDSTTGLLTGKPYGFLRQSAGNDAYVAHGLGSSTHVLLEFDQRKTVTFVGAQAARFPDPRGISGAPLWHVGFQEDGQLTSSVVAIAIEHRSKSRHKVIVCARVEPVVEMIAYLESQHAP